MRDPENKEKFLAALRKVEITDDPRGPMKMDDLGNATQNVYVRKVERVGGKLQNSVIQTYPNVSQFWTYKQDDYLKAPAYDRSYPPWAAPRATGASTSRARPRRAISASAAGPARISPGPPRGGRAILAADSAH